MQRLHTFALALLVGATFSLPATAQWKWRDKNGVMQFSDLPPPAGIKGEELRTRGGSRPVVVAAVPGAAAGASAPKGVEPELEAKRSKAEKEKAEKTKAEQMAEAERVAIAKRDNCSRAKGHMKSLEDGIRMSRTNASGEREVLDDKARAEEIARTREIIASDCS
jgi:Domain of unknown function (DUF4124)